MRTSLGVIIVCAISLLRTGVKGKALNNGVVSTSESMQLKDEQMAQPSEAKDPCVYKGKYLSVDLRKIAAQFKGENLTVPTGDRDYVYFLSLCSPITCSFSEEESPQDDPTGAAACQYVGEDTFIRLGLIKDSQFHFVNLTYFYITFTGGDSSFDAAGRQAQVNFLPTRDCSRKVTLEYNGEKESDTGIITYTFTVRMRMDQFSLFSLSETGVF